MVSLWEVLGKFHTVFLCSTASKASVFGVILVRIQSKCGKIRTIITPESGKLSEFPKSGNLHGKPLLKTFSKNGFRRKDTVKHLGTGLLGRFYFYFIDSANNIKNKKNMAYINCFKNSVKTSLLYLENEIIYFWIWRRKIKDKNSRQKLRIKILYIVYYLTHTAWGVTLSTGFFGKCEQICNLLRIWYLLKETHGGISYLALCQVLFQVMLWS